ncbi:MAG: hypothetical protein KDC98_04945 [Planctomycetes bacterium]|nr:hypothetical protein [Planctomycetota bacterium]
MITRHSTAAFLSLFLLHVGGAVLPGQDALRGWSSFSYDTDAYRLPATHIVSGGPTAVIRSDGRLYVHGEDTGNYGICNPPEPPPGLQFVDVAMNGQYAVGILSDGSVLDWNNNYSFWPSPPQLPPGVTYVSVAIGAEHALALRSDGVLVSWASYMGNAGVLTVIPPLPPGASVLKIAAGLTWSMVLLSNGNILTWDSGGTFYGETNVPPLPPGTRYLDLWAMSHVFARRSDGVIVTWGNNLQGQCNIPALPPGVSYVDFALGGAHTLALRSDGQLDAWGWNYSGQCSLTPLPPGLSVVEIAASGFTSLARLSDGSVMGWGGPYGGQPLRLPAVGQRFVEVVSGYRHAFAVTSDGNIVVEGPDSHLIAAVPPLPPGLRYEKVYAGWRHAAALRSDGQLLAWGDNPDGRCNVPPLPPGVTYVDAALASLHTVAIRSDGQAVGFGDPRRVPNLPTLPPGVSYVQADAQTYLTVLLRSDGVIVWGTSGGPTPPPGITYVEVATCESKTAALRSDGEIEFWGSAAIPVPPLPPGVVFVEIDAGYSHILARRSDGEVVAAGWIASGEDRIPPLGPGESYVQISAKNMQSVARVGPTTRYVAFANGCSGSRPTTRLIPRDTPRIGSPLRVTLFDLPQSAAFMVLGWNRITPTPLAQYGMPGCFQHISLDNAMLVLGQNNQAKFELPIPNWPGLVGLHFHNQAVVLDAGVNAVGAVLSDAAEGVIGHW